MLREKLWTQWNSVLYILTSYPPVPPLAGAHSVPFSITPSGVLSAAAHLIVQCPNADYGLRSLCLARGAPLRAHVEYLRTLVNYAVDNDRESKERRVLAQVAMELLDSGLMSIDLGGSEEDVRALYSEVGAEEVEGSREWVVTWQETKDLVRTLNVFLGGKALKLRTAHYGEEVLMRMRLQSAVLAHGPRPLFDENFEYYLKKTIGKGMLLSSLSSYSWLCGGGG